MKVISFPALIVLVLSFILSSIFGKLFIPWLKAHSKGQEVREDGPKTHYKKSGTPTFGGSIFLFSVLVFALLYLIYDFSVDLLAIILFVFAHAFIGFLDDYIKVNINKEGLSRLQKTILLLVVQALFALYYVYFRPGPVAMMLPWLDSPWQISGILKFFYFLFLLFYFYAATNAVNLTDGVDGLASSVSLVVLLFASLTGAIYQQLKLGENGVYLLHFALAGGLLAFYLYNRHPAQIFMGDLGSLSLGAALAVFYLYWQIPWAFALVGIIYVIEVLSVIIQGIYFRRTGGQRIFKMSPIHHHFELSGWSEKKIVRVFTLVTLIVMLLAALIIWPHFLARGA